MQITTEDYLGRLLPESGWVCVAQLLPSGSFKHFWFGADNLGAATAQLNYLDSLGHNCFVAQAAFKTQDNRKQVNADSLRNCFLDIDCGANKPYADQKEGAAGLKNFCAKTGLPLPSVINSGNGLYAHWMFATDVPSGIWKNVAQMLTQLVKLVEPRLDADGIIADSARVLRPSGMHNWKDPKNPKPVNVIHLADPIDFSTFSTLVQAALRSQGAAPEAPKRVHQPAAGEFSVAVDFGPKSDPEIIASKCQQVHAMRSTQGDLPEPLWYANLNILKHCENGEATAHFWSQGHKGYSREETDRKLHQSEVGPTTCHHFMQLNPTGCTACRFVGKITSPIQLGKPEPVKIEEADDGFKFIPPSHYYKITNEGVFQKADETWQRIYPHPCFVASLTRDAALGYEMLNIKHRDPHGEWHDIQVRSSLIHDTKAMLMAMHDQHLQAPMGEARKMFMSFLEDHMHTVRTAQKLGLTSSQMGWCGKDTERKFVLGTEIIGPEGKTEKLTASKTMPEHVKAFRAEGDSQVWIDLTKHLDAPHMEPQAFALLAGAFGAPLMKYSGYAGAMVAMVGESGVGKTLMGKWALSAYGDWTKLIMLKDDTRNALVSRLGVYGNLPAYIDEVSNMTGEELSELVHRVTQGRDKARLMKNAVERAGTHEWNTLAVVTTNHSLVEKLSYHKSEVGAELNRVFEYNVYRAFDRELGTKIHRAISGNFGGVGREYIQWLVDHQNELTDKLDVVTATIDKMTGAKADERFWSTVVGTAILGGMIAKSLGLIQFDVAKVMKWAADVIKQNRDVKTEASTDSFDMIGTILDKYVNGSLVVSGYDKKLNHCSRVARSDLKSQLVYRIEDDVMRCWISLDILKTEAHKRFVSMKKLKEQLGDALVDCRRRISLGRGTIYNAGIQPCWELDMNHPRLGYTVMRLIKQSEENSQEMNI